MIRLPATESGVRRAASLVRQGRVILWPSGGVYGLAASALCPEAIDRVYAAKGRVGEKPLQVLASATNASHWGMVEPDLQAIMDEVWPGYIGFVLRRKAGELAEVAGADDTVLLVCSNWVAGLLSVEADVPVVATSANLSGAPEIVTPDRAAELFADSVDALIDGGIQTGALNTLVDVSRQPYRILRQGALDARPILDRLAETGEK
jgi:L-threonylcarbamoyladenylate synthase